MNTGPPIGPLRKFFCFLAASLILAAGSGGAFLLWDNAAYFPKKSVFMAALCGLAWIGAYWLWVDFIRPFLVRPDLST